MSKAVILCGGQGTRIREASELVPKPMLPIGGRPILWHIMKSYAQHGVTEFVLCLGYKGWTIKEYFLNYRSFLADMTVTLGSSELEFHSKNIDENGWKITLAETGEATGTAGRLLQVKRYLEQEDYFFLTYGDAVSDLDIAGSVRAHKAAKTAATVTAVRPPGRFGEMRLHGGLVAEFQEKPEVSTGFINGGFFVMNQRVWDFIGADTGMLEQGAMQRLAAAHQLHAHAHDGFWQPMDTPREWSLLNELWATDKAPWKTW